MAEERNAADYLDICYASDTQDAFVERLLLEDGWEEVKLQFDLTTLDWQQGDTLTPEMLVLIANFSIENVFADKSPKDIKNALRFFNKEIEPDNRFSPLGGYPNERVFFHPEDMKIISSGGVSPSIRFRCYYAAFSSEHDNSLFDLNWPVTRRRGSIDEGAYREGFRDPTDEVPFIGLLYSASNEVLHQKIGVSLGALLVLQVRW